MRLLLDTDDLREMVSAVVTETLSALDWPDGRMALTEQEAAAACGVARHVLRDMRLAGKINGRKLGRKILYTRSDLLEALNIAARRDS